MTEFTKQLDAFPLIAILRGVTPERVCAVTEILIHLGFVCVEIPLNSPEPYKSIEILTQHFNPPIMIGAGTVTDVTQVGKVLNHGGRFIIMPHCDPEIINAAKTLGMPCIPGFSTPTEAWQAIHHQADALKFFPAAPLSSATLKAIKTILPPDIYVIPTGGVTPHNLLEFNQAGANAFAIGGELFRPQYSNEEIKSRAVEFIAALKLIKRG